MFAHKLRGIIALGALLLSGCSDDAAETATFDDASAAPQGRTAITFTCEQQDTRSAYGHEGTMNSTALYETGFGVFAGEAKDIRPNVMYNQEVVFTLVGDMENPQKGFWSYSPLKYWPNSEVGIANFDICAYAPYVEQPPADDGLRTGIIGMSDNAATTPYIEYRRANRASEVVDLLWWCYDPPTKRIETLNIAMNHALSRVKLQLKAESVPDGTKLLVKRITLTSKGMAKSGQLVLNSQTVSEGTILPVWQNQKLATAEIVIDKDATSTEYYGVVDQQLRYRDGLPYNWQPEGVTTTAANALTTIDRPAYLYLIPQEQLKLYCKVDLIKKTPTTETLVSKAVTDSIVIAPLKGNTPYTLNINLKGL